MPSAESGLATTEFWASTLAALAVLVHPFVNLTPDLQAALVTLIVTVYTVGRSLRKQGTSA